MATIRSWRWFAVITAFNAIGAVNPSLAESFSRVTGLRQALLNALAALEHEK